MLRVCVVRVDVNLLLLLLENFQRSEVSPPFAIYLSFFFSLLLLLFREGKQLCGSPMYNIYKKGKNPNRSEHDDGGPPLSCDGGGRVKQADDDGGHGAALRGFGFFSDNFQQPFSD